MCDGQHLDGVRVEELQSRHEHLSSATNAHGLAVGQRFGLSSHPRENLNTLYLCLYTQTAAQVNAEESGQGAGQFDHFTDSRQVIIQWISAG